MPNKNGTGPLGQGPRTGRGKGYCDNTHPFPGKGKGCGFGRGRNISALGVETNSVVLQSQKAILEEQLKAIDNQLSKL